MTTKPTKINRQDCPQCGAPFGRPHLALCGFDQIDRKDHQQLTTNSASSIQLATKDFAIMQNPRRLGEILTQNVGAGNLSISDLDRIKVPAGGGTLWEIQSSEGINSLRDLTGIIVHWAKPRSYWASAYKGENNPPDCSSPDGLVGYGTPGGSCNECPCATFGPDDEAPACRDTRAVFLVRPQMFLPVLLSLPPTSIRPFKSFMLRLASEGTPYWGSIVRFTLDKVKNTAGVPYSQASPSLLSKLTQAEADAVREYGNQIRPALERVSTMAAQGK